LLLLCFGDIAPPREPEEVFCVEQIPMSGKIWMESSDICGQACQERQNGSE